MDALDAAFGTTEGAVGDAHALSFRKLAVFIAKVFQPGLSRRGDKHKHVHLPVGDGIGSASAVIAMAGVEIAQRRLVLPVGILSVGTDYREHILSCFVL